MIKPNVAAQLMSQTGMGRPGGMASRGSASVSKGKGGGFAAMEQALLKSGVKNTAQAKKVTAGSPARQFNTKASGGDVSSPKPFSNVGISSSPTKALSDLATRQYGKVTR